MTMSETIQGITVVGAAGAGLIGGGFFAFSGFVLAALRQLPAAQGIGAMQAVNRTAVTPPLMLAFFCTAILSVVVGICVLWSWGEPAAPWERAGCLDYLATIVIPVAANVPLNNQLAGLNPGASGARAQWASFLTHWTVWNHLRGAAAVA